MVEVTRSLEMWNELSEGLKTVKPFIPRVLSFMWWAYGLTSWQSDGLKMQLQNSKI